MDEAKHHEDYKNKSPAAWTYPTLQFHANRSDFVPLAGMWMHSSTKISSNKKTISGCNIHKWLLCSKKPNSREA
jgi:hypothetical protein